MAFVYKAAGAVAEPVSALARSQDFGRMRDTYVLATAPWSRIPDCRRLWNDFVAEQPKMAELVVKDVEADRKRAAAANRELDGRLREAERMVTKGRKPKKVTKSRKRPAAVRDAQDTVLGSWLNSSNPAHREMAQAMLSERRG